MFRSHAFINGEKKNIFFTSWLLLKETWRFLKADKELLWVPFLVVVLVIVGVVGLTYLLAFLGLIFSGDEKSPLDFFIFLAVFFLVTSFVLALAQAIVINTVFTRLQGANATLLSSFRVALFYSRSIFIWSMMDTLLKIFFTYLYKFFKNVSFLVAMGSTAWDIITYFVVPTIVLDNKSGISAVKHSAAVLRSKWGETVITNVSLSAIFYCFYFLIVLGFATVMALDNLYNLQDQFIWVLAPIVLFLILLFIFLIFVKMTLDAILKTLLYIYASERFVPNNFDKNLLDSVLVSNKNPGLYNQSNETPRGIAS